MLIEKMFKMDFFELLATCKRFKRIKIVGLACFACMNHASCEAIGEVFPALNLSHLFVFSFLESCSNEIYFHK